MGFACEEDARRVLEVLPKRFDEYGLTLHPDKTRLVPFRRPSTQSTRRDAPAEPPPGTFYLLGFRHYWGRSRRGSWVGERKAAGGRLARASERRARAGRFHRRHPLDAQA